MIKGGDDLVGDEKRLMRELKQANLVKDYASISKFILSRAEQENVKNIFKEAAQDEEIFKIYAQLGLPGELVKPLCVAGRFRQGHEALRRASRRRHAVL